MENGNKIRSALIVFSCRYENVFNDTTGLYFHEKRYFHSLLLKTITYLAKKLTFAVFSFNSGKQFVNTYRIKFCIRN